MFSQQIIQGFVDGLVMFATDYLMPLMVFFFFAGIALRLLIYYAVRREEWFAKEFAKRVDRFIAKADRSEELSFFICSKRLLERTFYELFEIRGIMMRRRPDYISTLADRMFMIHQGCARLVKDTLKQIRHLKNEGHHPKIQALSKNVFENNPCFNRIFGVVPSTAVNDVLNILPGMFIIGGIFGTFLGIMKALPDLGGMDLNDIEGSKAIMDDFLLKVSFSMSTSIVGIILSVLGQIFNTLFSPDKVFVSTIDRFENALDIIWNRSTNNKVPEDIPDFDEHRDPLEALAEQAVRKQAGDDEEDDQRKTQEAMRSATIEEALRQQVETQQRKQMSANDQAEMAAQSLDEADFDDEPHRSTSAADRTASPTTTSPNKNNKDAAS